MVEDGTGTIDELIKFERASRSLAEDIRETGCTYEEPRVRFSEHGESGEASCLRTIDSPFSFSCLASERLNVLKEKREREREREREKKEN